VLAASNSVLVSVLLLVVVLVLVLVVLMLMLPEPPQALSPKASSSPVTKPRAELRCLTLDKSCGAEKEVMVINAEVFVFGLKRFHHQLMVNLKKALGSGVRSRCPPHGLEPVKSFFHGLVFSRWAVKLGSVTK